ncbi:MAG: hypothetical protein HY866_23290 [Chloroflexi bacterium]|nr:hypothetical protein [Chloroflexota bacterium]
MGFKVARYKDEAIVITHYLEPFDHGREPMEAAFEAVQLMSNVPGIIYNLLDLTGLELSFSDPVIGMGEMSAHQDEINSRFRPALIGTSEMIQLLASAAAQQQYGQREFPVFSTLEEALAFVHSKARLGKSA